MTGSPETFTGAWDASVAAHGDRPFLAFDDLEGHTRRWTYAEFDRIIDEVAGMLLAAGAGPGEGGAVHVALTNGPAFMALWLAALRIGAPLVPSDPRATDRELAGHGRRAIPAVAVLAPERAAAYAVAFPGVVVTALDASDSEFAALRSTASGRSEHRPAPADHAVTMFTSGTTSAPKGVVLTQAGYLFAGRTMADAASVTTDDRLLVVLPLFHANAQYYSCAAAIVRGACIVLLARFSASGFVDSAVEHRATHVSLFAAPIRMILARADPAQVAALRHCWFAQSLTGAQYEQIAALLGCRPRQLYGMTETLPAVITTPADAARADVMGTVTPGCAVVLLDPDSRAVVAPGDIGELAVGGRPGHELFAEYLDDPETTAASFHDGWFLTGDLARADPDGLLRFVGRRGDVLKVSGENVSTVEVEAVIAEHAGVEDVAVVGAPDAMRDEVPVAHVVGSASAEALAAWCAERLAPSKCPREFIFHTELPRTSVGKIRKFQLTPGS